jgi:ABC-type spermidine/putrescine transport system permease subunit II
MTAQAVLAPSIGRWRPALVVVALLLAAFLLLPGAMIVVASLSRGEFLSFPPDGVSLRWYRELVSDPSWREALWTSLRIAAGGTLLATVGGTCAALGMTRLRGRGRALRSAFLAPMALPYIAYVLGLYKAFDGLGVLGASWPIMLGQGVLAFPIVFVTIDATLATVDPHIANAASSLGARWPMVVARIEVPLVLPSIVASALFAFSFCFDEVVIALFLSGPETVTFPIKIFSSAQDSVSPELAAASSAVTVLVLAIAALFAVVLRRSARRTRA